MDVAEAIRTRRSIRKFRREEMPEDMLTRLLEAARQAPSGANRQPWEIVAVTQDKMKRQLVPICKNQKFIEDCSVFLVGVDDPLQKWARVDLTIALDHVSLMAEEMGLGTCWIGAFDPQELAERLDIPAGKVITVCLAIGYPDERPEGRNRKPMSELFHRETYGKRY